MKILHISESFEGGVAAAVANYVSLTNEHEHFLLCSTRSGRIGSGILQKFSTVYDLTNGHFSAIKTVQSMVDKVKPDVIHCHSSFGGAYGRLAYFWRKCPALVIYSPHCYAFERRDISWFARSLFYIMEWVMAKKTDVVVACSPREKRLAKKLRKKTRTIFVPNLASVDSDTSLPFGKRKNVVAMMGRLSPQKDPEWFAGIAKRMGDSTKFVWVGDGEEKYRKALEASGVEVTGWVKAEEVVKILSTAKIYLHTAEWEGFPVALLDARQCGVAIVAREAAYLEGMSEARPVEGIANAAREIETLSENVAEWQKNRSRWEKVLEKNTPSVAKERLATAYGCVAKKVA